MIKKIENLAKAYNTLNADLFEPLLVNDFTYESQMVFGCMEGKADFMEYIKGKFNAIKKSSAWIYAEIGYSTYNNSNLPIEELMENGNPCLIMAQSDKSNISALLMPEFNCEGKIIRMDMCGITPHWSTAKRTGIYPGLE
ncbi:MAG: hypothetical protein RL115_529 [Bacteroidota bacterium]|jgi:hypothetical protein